VGEREQLQREGGPGLWPGPYGDGDRDTMSRVGTSAKASLSEHGVRQARENKRSLMENSFTSLGLGNGKREEHARYGKVADKA
jgi:hypothetical protein